MHDGVIWFDTAGCLNGRKIGDVNAVSVTATRTTKKRWGKNCLSFTDGTTTLLPADSSGYCPDEQAYYTEETSNDPNWGWNRTRNNLVVDGNTFYDDGEFADYDHSQWSRDNREPTGAPSSTWWTSSTEPYGEEYDTNEQRIHYDRNVADSVGTFTLR